MQFMLRDDDTCFFTDPGVLSAAYGDLWAWCPVSLAVIPFVVETRNWGEPETFWQNDVPHPIGENPTLVDTLKAWRDRGHVSIILHGHRHRYLPGPEPASWIPEFVHLRDPAPAIREGRDHLESVFGSPIRTFTPPSNALSARAYAALRGERLHLTQLHPFRVAGGGHAFDELTSGARRLLSRVRFGRDYPGVLDVGTHAEVSNLPITPRSSRAAVFEDLEYRHQRGGAVCVSTHHWELDRPIGAGDGETVRKLLGDVLAWLERRGARPRTGDALLGEM